MLANDVLFETIITVKSGTPYIQSSLLEKSKLIITWNEIHVITKRWTYIIPLHRVYSCETKPIALKTWSLFGELEGMHNFLFIRYLDEKGRENVFTAAFIKYFWSRKNVIEAMRFDETIKYYNLQDKFIKTPPPSSSGINI